MSSLPLSGIRVLELAGWMSGPCAGAILGDLGADVIKIELPRGGDPTRGIHTLFGGSGLLPGARAVGFESVNRNKRSVTLDLTTEAGQDIFRKVALTADVVLTNYSARVLQALRLTRDDIAAFGGNLVYALGTSFGTAGDYVDRRSFDQIMQAVTGLMWSAGDRSLEVPVPIGNGLVDYMSGTLLAQGVLAALIARQRFDEPQFVEVSMLDAVIHYSGLAVNTAMWREYPIARHNRLEPKNPLCNYYECRDHQWIMIWEPQSDKFWPDFCQAMDFPTLVSDPRYATLASRLEHGSSLYTLFGDRFHSYERDYWLRKFAGFSFAYAPVNTVMELLESAAAMGATAIRTIVHPTMGATRMVASGIQLNTATHVIPAPELGEHTELFLTEEGICTWDDISRLKEAGVI